MTLPFTPDAFFDVFARYNAATLPAVVLWWLAAAAALAGMAFRPGPSSDRLATVVLAGLWLWGGLVYHAGFFTAINPAAWAFAALFVVEVAALVWFGLARRVLRFGTARGVARVAGLLLAIYALAYPFVTALSGHTYPASPTFGVPCPTAIFTVGLLVSSRRPPLAVQAVPMAWAVIGGSAAVVLGVTADYALLACALGLPAHALATRLTGDRAA